jgi:hypothetical protein
MATVSEPDALVRGSSGISPPFYPPEAMATEKNSAVVKRDQEEFIKAIKDQIAKGFTFTPLIGSGVSAASGLILGSDLEDYLTYVVYRAVAPTKVQPLESFVRRSRWCVRGDGWPRRPTENQMNTARIWLAERYRLMLDERVEGLPLPPPFPSSLVDFDPAKGNGARSGGEQFAAGEMAKYGVEPVLWEAQMAEVHRLIRISRNQMHGWGETMRVTDLWSSFFLSYDEAKKKLEERRIGEAAMPIEELELKEGPIIERALRSLGDWKSTLAFLSRLFTSAKRQLCYTDKPKLAVVDRFNTHISWGQKPNLAHTLLVHLSRPLGIRKLITTNFDTLIEQAFDEAEIPLRVVEATTSGELPDPEIVRSAATLIKIHGGNHQTRADFTLNQRASIADRRAFCGYLLPKRRLGSRESCNFSKSHLLLLGVGGGDWRMNDMVDHALRTIPELKVFCVANSSSSAAKLNAVFQRWIPRDGSTAEPRVLVSELGKADIALLRIYQEIALALPPGGFSSRLVQPIPPWLAEQEHIQAAKGWIVQSLPIRKPKSGSRLDKLKPLQLDDEGNTLKVKLEPRDEDGWLGYRVDCHLRSGVVFVLGSLFFGYEQMYRPSLWFELEDFAGPGELIGQIVMLLAIRRGLHQTSHVDFDKHPGIPPEDAEAGLKCALAEWLCRMLDYLNLDASQCALFFYGRNGSGGCSGFDNEYWRGAENAGMERLCDVLASIGFHVYYAPFSEPRMNDAKIREEDIGALAAQIMPAEPLPGDQAEYFKLSWPDETPVAGRFGPLSQRIPRSLAEGRTDGRTSGNSSADGKAERKIRWNQLTFKETARQVAYAFLLGKKDNLAGPKVWKEVAEKVKDPEAVEGLWDRLLFLYACTLFRQSRHYTALISEGTYPCPCRYSEEGDCDNDMWRSSKVQEWIKSLKESCDLFHEKSGGFLWMYRDTRLGLQHLLERLRDIRLPGKDGVGSGRERGFDFLVQNRARLHYWIGDWYRQAFFSTGHIIPLGEAFYHWVMALRFVPWLKQATKSMKAEHDAAAIAHRRLQMVVSALGEMAELIDQGESAICFWSPGDPASRLANWRLIAEAIELECGVGPGGPQQDSIDSGKVEEWLKRTVGNGLLLGPDFAWGDHVILVEGLLQRVRLSAKMAEAKARGEAALNGWSHPRGNPRSPDRRSGGSSSQVLDPSFPFAGLAVDFSLDLVRSDGAGNSVGKISRFMEKLFQEPAGPDVAGSPRLGPTASDLKQEVKWTYELDAAGVQACFACGVGTDPRERRLSRVSRVFKTFGLLSYFCLEKPDAAFVLIEALAECAYFRVKRAKLLERTLRAAERCGWEGDEKGLLRMDARAQWLICSTVCSLGLMSLRLTYSQGGEERTCLKQKLLSLYGLSLSYLGRFHEAHKRINEATALSDSLGSSERARSKMILRLRRAEIHLVEAEHARAKGSDGKLGWAVKKVDDAVFSLDAAQHVMMGISQSSLWWSRFYALNLRVLNLGTSLVGIKVGTEGKELPLSMAFRRMHDYFAHVGDYFVRADLLCHEDAYRSLRFVDYAYSCLHALYEVLREELDDPGMEDRIKESSPRLLEKIGKSWKRAKEWRGDGSRWSVEMNRYFELVEKCLPDFVKNAGDEPQLR